jgi:FixJ family two-component response regulator
MEGRDCTVFILDPDPDVRSALRNLISTMNLPCQEFANGRSFLAACTDSSPACLVTEVKIPDMSGLQIQRRLAGLVRPLPIIFLSAHSDVSLAVELMRGGAVHYLLKPVRAADFLSAIQEALARGYARWRAAQRRQRVREGIARLSGKERDILQMIGEGKDSRTMAKHLGVSLRAVQLRRASVMKELRLTTPTALLHFALLAKRIGWPLIDAHRRNARFGRLGHANGRANARVAKMALGGANAGCPDSRVSTFWGDF